MMPALRRVLTWAFVVGGVSFAVGFFGPLIWAPDANQGPLLGIFITGPLGTLAGFVIGVLREFTGNTATPFQALSRRGMIPSDPATAYRLAAGLVGIVLLTRGLIALPQGEGRPAAASIVVAAVLLWYAVAGHVPAWFRR